MKALFLAALCLMAVGCGKGVNPYCSDSQIAQYDSIIGRMEALNLTSTTDDEYKQQVIEADAECQNYEFNYGSRSCIIDHGNDEESIARGSVLKSKCSKVSKQRAEIEKNSQSSTAVFVMVSEKEETTPEEN